MRTFGPILTNIVNEIKLGNDPYVNYFVLIDIELSDTLTYYATNYKADIEFEGNIYRAKSGLYKINLSDVQNNIDTTYDIQLVDLANELTPYFNTTITGRPLQVRWGFVDQTTGQPALDDYANIETSYRGYVNGKGSKYNMQEGTYMVTITGAGPLSAIEKKNTIMISNDGMDQIDPTDTSYDEIYAGREGSYSWGRVQ